MPDTLNPAESQPRLIRHGQLIVDDSRLFAPPPDAEDGTAAFPADEPGWIVPLEVWLSRDVQACAKRQHALAIQLAPDSTLETLFSNDDAASLQAQIRYIAIDFPAYTDGRGYSLAQLLRRQYGWQGELRASGDVMIDTMHYMARCGFDSFLVKPTHNPAKALAALGTFSVQYQKSYPAVERVTEAA